MLYLFSGTDTEKSRAAMEAAFQKTGKGAELLRITDVHSRADMEVALRGRGMFDKERIVVFDNVYLNDELKEQLQNALPILAKSDETYFILEGILDTPTRKGIEKYAEKSERFDSKKAGKPKTIFALANALQAGKKKELWVGYQRELISGEAPEAIHGVLFWAAKQYVLRNSSDRAKQLVADLAELPHEARRQGEELEYALERFVLSFA